MEKEIFNALVCMFKAMVCSDDEDAMDYVNEVPLKWLRETLEREGYNFNPFEENDDFAFFELSSLADEYLKEHDKISKPLLRKHLSEYWFPFNEREVELVLTEVKKRKIEVEKEIKQRQ